MTHAGPQQKRWDRPWGWGTALAAFATAVVPQLVVLTLVPGARTAAVAAGSTLLVLNIVAVGSGVFLYLHHRLTSSDSTAWLSCGFLLAGGAGLTITGVGLASTHAQPSTPLDLLDLFVAISLLAVVHVAERTQLRVDPAATGLAIGIVVSGLAIALTTFDLAPRAPGVAWEALAVPLVVVGTVVAWEVRRLTTLQDWARNQLAIAVAALAVGRAAWVDGGADGSTKHLVVSAGASTLAAVLLLATSMALLRVAIYDDRAAITALQDQLAATTEDARADRERLHEVKGTIAGIASASRLIHHDTRLPAPSREMLQEMVERESARLQRLVHGGDPTPIGPVLVDEVLRPLVVGRQAQGQRVTWRPSGAAVWAREDDLTEVLNILLDNTARHAAGAAVAVVAHHTGERVEIVVADSGPGVPPELRSSVFDRGARGDCSTGDGLGLHVARRLMRRCGGSLELADGCGRGAAFVVSCQAHLVEARHDDAARFVAQ